MKTAMGLLVLLATGCDPNLIIGHTDTPPGPDAGPGPDSSADTSTMPQKMDSGDNPDADPATGAQWTVQASGTTNHLYGFWADGQDLYAVGAGGTILRSGPGTGQKWTAVPSGTTADLFAIGLGYIVGANQTILALQSDKTWKILQGGGSNTIYYAIAGNSSDYQHVVTGSNGTILVNWRSDTSGTQVSLRGACPSLTSNEFLVVGDHGTLLAANGTPWQNATSNTDKDLYGIALGDHENCAVGAAGTVRCTTDGFTWRTVNVPTPNDLFAIWENSIAWEDAPADAYIVGAIGTILHRAHGVWKTETAGTDRSFFGVWASSGDGVYAAGSGGVIIHRSSVFDPGE